MIVQNIVIVVSQKRHARGRPRLSLSYVENVQCSPIVGMTASLKPVFPRAKNHPPRQLFTVHLLLLLRVLQDALGFQTSPCLLKSPSLNAAQRVSN
jgi:hypothetical protein